MSMAQKHYAAARCPALVVFALRTLQNLLLSSNMWISQVTEAPSHAPAPKLQLYKTMSLLSHPRAIYTYFILPEHFNI